MSWHEREKESIVGRGMRNDALLGAFAGASVVADAVVLCALRYVLVDGVYQGMKTFYRLAAALLLSSFATHLIDIAFIPILKAEDPTKDSLPCSLHGALYMYALLYFYFTSMFLSVESFLCLTVSQMSRSAQEKRASRRWKIYLITSIIGIHAQFLHVAFTLEFGRNDIGCSFKGSNGANSGLSPRDTWTWHAVPSMTCFISLCAVAAIYILLAIRLKINVQIRMKIISRMALLPVLGYLTWGCVMLRRFGVGFVENLPIREMAALKGLYMSIFLCVVNDKIRDAIRIGFHNGIVLLRCHGDSQGHIGLNERLFAKKDYERYHRPGGGLSYETEFTQIESCNEL